MYPFERFTQEAKQVLSLAQEEAERSRHSYIGTEHLLLAILRNTDTLAGMVLVNLGIELGRVRAAIESILSADEALIIQQIIPTSRIKRVIEISFEEARRMRSHHVGSEHLLLGLLLEGGGIAARVLEDLGANLERVRGEIERLLADPGWRAESARRAAVDRVEAERLALAPDVSGLLEVIDAAIEAARSLGDADVKAEHLLRALAEVRRRLSESAP